MLYSDIKHVKGIAYYYTGMQTLYLSAWRTYNISGSVAMQKMPVWHHSQIVAIHGHRIMSDLIVV